MVLHDGLRARVDELAPEGQRAHLRPLVVVALGTGLRLGDQLNLRWAKVDFQHNLIHVPNAKTGQEYDVPMNQDVRRELQSLKRPSAGAEYVFMSARTGTRVKEVKKGFKTACRLAGITDLRWHDLHATPPGGRGRPPGGMFYGFHPGGCPQF